MTQEPKKTIIMLIGQTGAGKSSIGNGFLQVKQFEIDSSPYSCTFKTGAQQNLVNNYLRMVIDTQGINDTQGLDDEHVTQMIEFLREWEYGVNAIGIVINGQAPKFDEPTKKLIKLIHVFFNDLKIWDSVFIVFTRWYKGVMEPEEKESKKIYVDEVRKLARECMEDDKANPQLPYYFVDAKKEYAKFDSDTKDEFVQMNAFAVGKPPISTKNFQKPNVNYFKVFEEVQKNVLLSEVISPDKMKRTRNYADQKRERQVGYDGTVSYSDWVNTRTWSKTDEKKIEEEVQNKVQLSKEKVAKFRTQRGSHKILGLFGGRSKFQVYDHTDVTTYYEDRKRDIVTDFDGNVSYGEWIQLRVYTEDSKEA